MCFSPFLSPYYTGFNELHLHNSLTVCPVGWRGKGSTAREPRFIGAPQGRDCPGQASCGPARRRGKRGSSAGAAAWPGSLSPDPQGSPPALAPERCRRPLVQSGAGSPLARASVCSSAEWGNRASSLRPRGNEMSGCSCHFGTMSGPRWGLCKH